MYLTKSKTFHGGRAVTYPHVVVHTAMQGHPDSGFHADGAAEPAAGVLPAALPASARQLVALPGHRLHQAARHGRLVRRKGSSFLAPACMLIAVSLHVISWSGFTKLHAMGGWCA